MTLSKMKVDYTLYLVTDSGMVPESSSFLKQVEDSINSGATIVQLREKSLSTLEFIKRAEQVHKLTQKQGIPLIINDRVDVALAVNAEGVHVGQDDMPAAIARKLIGDDKILGVTCLMLLRFRKWSSKELLIMLVLEQFIKPIQKM